MIILIPSYEPDQRLVDLVGSILGARPDQRIVVVDDGSGPAYAHRFAACEQLGATVVGHPTNRGKGFALKRGIALIAAEHPGEDVVCADSDGQHTLADILAVAAELERHDRSIVLGARQFVGDVPPRSRFGNTVTRAVFDAATGTRLTDTQTGLRGYPATLLAWLGTIPGDRFEYELDVLLEATRAGIDFEEVPIETVYLEGNASSHFRTVRDSVRVYVPVAKFCLSSLFAFMIDAALFFALMAATGNLLLSVVTARVVSATVNFTVNRHLVFAGDRSRGEAAVRYAALVVVLMGANYALLDLLTQVLAMPVVPAKLLTELTLFVASYQIQRRVVFRRRRGAVPAVGLVPVAEVAAPEPASEQPARAAS